MGLKEQIDRDLKTAMLAGDKTLVTTLRGVKSAILYAEVAKGSRDKGLPDNEITELLRKEAKKRQESADLYLQGGDQTRQAAELEEKKVIEQYLPPQMPEDQIKQLVDSVITQMGEVSMKDIGRVIGQVKSKAGETADSAVIARLAKERLAQ